MRFFIKSERILLRFAALSLAVLALAQGAASLGPWRWSMNWAERMGAVPVARLEPRRPDVGWYEEAASFLPDECFVVFGAAPFSALPHSRIVVNGVPRATFAGSAATVAVAPGDRLEIDSSYYRFPVRYEVLAVSGPLAFPAAGQFYPAQQNIVIVGQIVVQ
jgi:hypothetical protein